MTQKITLSKRIGRNLKNHIKASKYKTQDKFATEAMYVDPSTVRRWIAHGINDIDNLEKIAAILEIDILELLK